MNKTLNNFKKDPTPRHYGGAGAYEEPTRDPEVWPPPTPVEREKRYIQSKYKQLMSCKTATPPTMPLLTSKIARCP